MVHAAVWSHSPTARAACVARYVGPAHACWHVHSSYHVHSVCDIGPGAFWFLLGCAAVTAMYAKPVAMLAILFLSFGDPAASAAGVTFGDRYSTRLPFAPRKSLVGLMAASVACGVVVSLYSAVLPDLGLSALPLSTRVCQLRERIQWPLRVYTNAFDMVVRLRVMYGNPGGVLRRSCSDGRLG